jgi:uncharacterized membrane protein YdbT with pleckstrin-like domain
MEPETIICEVTPSQILNLRSFIFCILAMVLIIIVSIFTYSNSVLWLLILPAAFAFWKWWEIKSKKLRLTSQRIIVSEGVLNRTTNETELYRVRDTTIEEPFLYRLFKVGNVIVFTTDEANAVLHLKAFKAPHSLKDQIRHYSEICRQNRRWGNDNVLIHEHLG